MMLTGCSPTGTVLTHSLVAIASPDFVARSVYRFTLLEYCDSAPDPAWSVASAEPASNVVIVNAGTVDGVTVAACSLFARSTCTEAAAECIIAVFLALPRVPNPNRRNSLSCSNLLRLGISLDRLLRLLNSLRPLSLHSRLHLARIQFNSSRKLRLEWVARSQVCAQIFRVPELLRSPR